MLERNPHEEMSLKSYMSTFEVGWGVGAWGDVSPKGSEPKEMWGDKGREGTQKNGILGRRLLWMVPNIA